MRPKSGCSMPLTTRLDVNLGYKCNNDCLFCYFKDRKDICAPPSTDECKKRLFLIRRMGIDTAEFTGGEVTLREDLIELISFAKKKLNFKKISIISNGSRLCDNNFAEDVVRAGVDDVIISVHGHNAELHDRLSGRQGAFKESIAAISNVLRHGISCRTNTVITKLNFDKLPEIGETIYQAGVSRINCIFFSPLDDALALQKDLGIKYSDAAPFVKKLINNHKDKFKTISIKVIPFCFMEKYEEYITDLFQNLYDPYEWDYYCRVSLRRSPFTANLAAIGGILLFMDMKRILSIGLRKSLREGIMHTEAFRHCVKPKACKKCKFDLICPGVWKSYARQFGLNEVSPVSGDRISEISQYLDKRFAGYYKQGEAVR